MTSHIRIVVPAFFDSDQPSNPVWTELVWGGREIAIAVFDDPNILAGVEQRIHAARIKVFGYVHTSTLTIPLQQVEQAMDAWFNRFRDLDGIFVDEGPPLDANNPEQQEPQWVLDYLSALYQHVKQTKANAKVYLNCAGCRDVRVLSYCDIGQPVEATSAQYDNPGWWQGASESWWTTPPAGKQIAHVVHDTLPADLQTALTLLEQRTPTYGYIFDGTSSAYSRLPTYWRQEVKFLRTH